MRECDFLFGIGRSGGDQSSVIEEVKEKTGEDSGVFKGADAEEDYGLRNWEKFKKHFPD